MALMQALGVAKVCQLRNSSSESDDDSDDSVITIIENPSATPWMNSSELKSVELLTKPKVNPQTTVARVPGFVRKTMNKQSMVKVTSDLDDLTAGEDREVKLPVQVAVRQRLEMT